MKALSLWQPWASLLAHGHKRIETRPWAVPPSIIGKPVAICSTRSWNVQQREAASEPYFLQNYPSDILLPPADLPRGVMLGVGFLAGCEPIDQKLVDHLKPAEFAFGFYAHGRFAWIFSSLYALTTPIPVSGAQGFWNLPDDIEAQATDQLKARAREARAAQGRDLHVALG